MKRIVKIWLVIAVSWIIAACAITTAHKINNKPVPNICAPAVCGIETL